jgi:hypothetical protein
MNFNSNITQSEKEEKRTKNALLDPYSVLQELLFMIAQLFADEFGKFPEVEGLDEFNKWLKTGHNLKNIYYSEIIRRLEGVCAYV